MSSNNGPSGNAMLLVAGGVAVAGIVSFTAYKISTTNAANQAAAVQAQAQLALAQAQQAREEAALLRAGGGSMHHSGSSHFDRHSTNYSTQAEAGSPAGHTPTELKTPSTPYGQQPLPMRRNGHGSRHGSQVGGGPNFGNNSITSQSSTGISQPPPPHQPGYGLPPGYYDEQGFFHYYPHHQHHQHHHHQQHHHQHQHQQPPQGSHSSTSVKGMGGSGGMGGSQSGLDERSKTPSIYHGDDSSDIGLMTQHSNISPLGSHHQRPQQQQHQSPAQQQSAPMNYLQSVQEEHQRQHQAEEPTHLEIEGPSRETSTLVSSNLNPHSSTASPSPGAAANRGGMNDTQRSVESSVYPMSTNHSLHPAHGSMFSQQASTSPAGQNRPRTDSLHSQQQQHQLQQPRAQQAPKSPYSTQELINISQAQLHGNGSFSSNADAIRPSRTPVPPQPQPQRAASEYNGASPSMTNTQNSHVQGVNTDGGNTDFFSSIKMEESMYTTTGNNSVNMPPQQQQQQQLQRHESLASNNNAFGMRQPSSLNSQHMGGSQVVEADPVASFLTKKRMMNEVKTDLLKHAPIFKQCTDEDIADLAACLKHESYGAGDEICHEGSFGDCMYFVANGQVNTFGKDGQVLRKCGEGDFFGEFCLFRGGVRLATCIASTPTDLFSLSRDPLMEVVARVPQLKEGIEKEVIKKVIECEYPLSQRSDPQTRREMQMRIDEEMYKLQQRKDTNITFQLNKKIGSGASGEVYSAIDTNTGQPLAVKVVSTKGMTPAMIVQVEQESTLCDQLQHENIIDGYGMSKDEEACELYVLMELMPMGSLHSLVKEYGPLTEGTVRTYVRQMLQGLAYLHMKGILHRDIKPANALISAKGVVKLADFGICRQGLQFQTTTITGTPAYMSPEAIEGKYGVASDIWAVGMTVIELITGAPPWSHLNSESSTSLIFSIFNAKDGHPLPEVVDPLEQKKEIEAQQQAETDGLEEIPGVNIGISKKFHSFLAIMLSREPRDRQDCDTLLQHEWFNADAEEIPNVPLQPLLNPEGMTYYGTEKFADDQVGSHKSITEQLSGMA